MNKKMNKLIGDVSVKLWAMGVLFGLTGVVLKKPFGVTVCVMIAVMWTLTRILAEAINTIGKNDEEKDERPPGPPSAA